MQKLILSLLMLTSVLGAHATDFSQNGFAAWRADHGDWFEAGGVYMNPDEPTQLSALPGHGLFINGASGRTTHLLSKNDFADVRLHVEFLVPQNSNSGVYLMGRYEIQVRDSYKKDSRYPGNECGGIYQRWDEKRTPKGYEGRSPDIDAARPPGQWQWYDILFRAPRFDASGHKIENARFEKVYHNGFLVHENVELTGPTRSSLFDDEQPTGPLMLQGDHGPVAYRNIRILPAEVNPFFAMDTSVKDAAHLSFESQIKMLQALGYEGMDHTGVDNLTEKQVQLDRHSLRLFAVYLDVWADRDKQSFNDGLERAAKRLKGRDVVLWVPIRSHDFEPSSEAGDEQAVAIIRRIADIAAANDLTVALYPHSFFYLQTVDDALRLVEQVGRKNVGLTFNLCHWLRVDNSDLKSLLQKAAPFLFMVTINGADNEGDWKQLIQPLDAGDYDVTQVLDLLKKIDYRGPIGLQGYGIGGNVEDNLRRSMQTWRKMQHIEK